MANNRVNKKGKYSDYDIAVFIAMEKFYEKHSRETQPDWLDKYIMITGRKNENEHWIIQKILFRKIQLESNQYWGHSAKGTPILIEVDPMTGKESVVFKDASPSDIEVIFEVEVDLINGSAIILLDTDLSKLDETRYEVQVI